MYNVEVMSVCPHVLSLKLFIGFQQNSYIDSLHYKLAENFHFGSYW